MRAPLHANRTSPTLCPTCSLTKQLVFQAEASDIGGLGPAKNWLALTILLLVLVGIASERIHRVWCAMIGAAAMVRCGGGGQGQWQWASMLPLGCRRRCRHCRCSRSCHTHQTRPRPAAPTLQMGLLLWMNMTPSLALVMEWLDESTLGE